MQVNDMAEKIKVKIDGVERPELISFEEVTTEKAIVEIPEYRKRRKVTNGVIDIPVLNLSFKVQRDSDTIKFFKDWYFNDEVKDLIKIRTDAHGIEFGRSLFPLCECAKFTETAYDGNSPTFSVISTTLVPYDMIVQE